MPVAGAVRGFGRRVAMRWDVEGADTTTGKDVRLTVEAVTREEAERLARYNGILVATVSRPAPAPSIDYEPPPAAAAPGTGPPEYPDLLFAARWLRRLSHVTAGFGLLYALGAMTYLLATVFSRPFPRLLDYVLEVLFGSPTSLLPITLMALGCFITAAVLRLLGGLAMARRDLARNSFTR
jgi:hypothetical protein